MNQKHCRGCPHVDSNEMSDEMYCKLKDYEQIRLRWHKHRPDWCPLVTGAEREETNLISRQAAIDALDALCDRECEYSKQQRIFMCGACRLGSAFDVIDELPSAQPEIIHCRDCKHWQSEEYIGNNNVHTPNIASLPCKNWLTGGDWYCGSAERKDT